MKKQEEIVNSSTEKKETVEHYMYLAEDDGKYFGDKKDPEICVWVDYDDVENALVYENLKEFWEEVYPKIKDKL